jgi:hypothetical protein
VKVLYKLWDHLHDSVVTGKPSWSQAFPSANGEGEVDVFEQIYKTDQDKKRFLSAMHGMAKTSIEAIVNSLERFLAEFELLPSTSSTSSANEKVSCALSSSFLHFSLCLTFFRLFCKFELKEVVDLGGGSGALALGITAKFKSVSSVVVDLPLALSEARCFLDIALSSTTKDEGLFSFSFPSSFSGSLLTTFSVDAASRVRLQEGNFFLSSSALPTGDLYVLSRILHDWDDEKSETILQRAFYSLRPGGSIVLVEKLLDDSDLDGSAFGAACGPLETHLQSLNMLVQTEGRERTAAQFGVLLKKVGFERFWTCKTGTAFDLVAAFKPVTAAQ